MNTKLFIITGVNGIGKSSVIPELQPKLNIGKYRLHDFDERGVPDSAGTEWRKSETTYWFNEARENALNNISTIVCGFMKASDIDFAHKQIPDVEFEVCLLDADAKTIATRIMSRYQTPESLMELERTTGKTPERFAEDNVWVSGKFRESATENGFYILDTRHQKPNEVASDIMSWLSK